MDVHITEYNIETKEIEGDVECTEVVRFFDIEPDNKEGESNLAKRDRYYQAINDAKLLDAGENYEKMPELWSIWILPYDPFGENYMIYSVKNQVENLPHIQYNDGVTKIYLYTEGTINGNEELKNLLQYIRHTKEEYVTDNQLQRLHSEIQRVKRRKEVAVRYLTIERNTEYRIQKEIKKGIEEQLKERLKELTEERVKELTEEQVNESTNRQVREMILKVLRKREHELPKDLVSRIENEKEKDKLEKWFDLALESDDIKDFMEMIEE